MNGFTLYNQRNWPDEGVGIKIHGKSLYELKNQLQYTKSGRHIYCS